MVHSYKNFMIKKGVLLNCSPNRHGSSYYVLNEIYKAIYKNAFVELIHIYDLDIKKCDECQDYCYKKGICKIKNDDMGLLYDHFEESDFVIIATPVYFYHLPGYAKLMIDRCQPYWVRKYVLKNYLPNERFGGLVSIAATKGEKLFSGINLTIKYFFDIFNIKFCLNNNLYIKKVETKSELNNHKNLINLYINNLKKKLNCCW